MTTKEDIQKKIIFLIVLDLPASIMIGLGLYGKFAANGDAFHPLLNDASVVNALLTVGVVLMGFCAYKVLSLIKQRNQLE